jgi:hypothetical protein
LKNEKTDDLHHRVAQKIGSAAGTFSKKKKKRKR